MRVLAISILLLAQTVPAALQSAREQAAAGQIDAAFATLRTLVDNGFPRADALNADDGLIPLRSDPRWDEIIAAARANLRPCERKPVYRQFDYWLGEWDVEVGGERVARSSIQLVLGDCAIYENYWRLDGTYAGKSFSVWDAQQNRWEQRYVDTTGASRDWFGGLEEGTMIFHLRPDANGGKSSQRMTYTKQGADRVRQLIESSSDGETWSVAFDGIYVRRK